MTALPHFGFRRLIVPLAALILGSCAFVSSEPRRITYRVTGTASSADINFNNETEGMDHVKSGYDFKGDMFWEKTITLTGGKMAYVTAQNNGSHGSVTVGILSDGNVIKLSQSSGAYCMATASATVGVDR